MNKPQSMHRVPYFVKILDKLQQLLDMIITDSRQIGDDICHILVKSWSH